MRDLQASRRFYEEVMGFDVIQHAPVALLLRLGGDHTYVVVQTRRAEGMGLFNHNGVDVSTEEEVRAAYEALVSVQDDYGIRRIDKPCRRHGAFSFFFADPDGNWWEILANQRRGYSPTFDDPEADLTGRTDLTEEELRGGNPPTSHRSSNASHRLRRQAMGLEVVVHRELCVGSGNCTYWLPGVFELDDEGCAFVVDSNGASADKIVLAAQRCPTHAISVNRDGHTIV